MGSVYDARWVRMRDLCASLNDKLAKDPHLVLFDDSHPCHSGFIINESQRSIVLQEGDTCYAVFSGDTDFDEGVYTPLKTLLSEFQSRFSLYRKIEYTIIE